MMMVVMMMMLEIMMMITAVGRQAGDQTSRSTDSCSLEDISSKDLRIKQLDSLSQRINSIKTFSKAMSLVWSLPSP